MKAKIEKRVADALKKHGGKLELDEGDQAHYVFASTADAYAARKEVWGSVAMQMGPTLVVKKAPGKAETKCAVCFHPRSAHDKGGCQDARCRPFRCEGFTTEAQARARTAKLFSKFGL